jgi:hypothetical protein
MEGALALEKIFASTEDGTLLIRFLKLRNLMSKAPSSPLK